MEQYPGEDKALALGYSCHNYTPDYKKATYVKHVENDRGRPTHVILWLIIGEFAGNSIAEITSSWKGCTITSGKIAWPHPSFDKFEKQVIHIAEAAQLVT